MTHHDLLIDTLMTYLYNAYDQGRNDEPWDFYNDGEVRAQEILEIVEEFQQMRINLAKNSMYSSWRASD